MGGESGEEQLYPIRPKHAKKGGGGVAADTLDEKKS